MHFVSRGADTNWWCGRRLSGVHRVLHVGDLASASGPTRTGGVWRRTNAVEKLRTDVSGGAG